LRKTNAFVIVPLLWALAALSQGNQPSSSQKPASAATKSHSGTAVARPPSTEELNGFMRHMFGYDPMVRWKIESVKPSEVPGVTEVVIAFGDPVQQRTPFYVTSDLQHAFIGQIIPFGADPFAPVRHKLAEQAKGPVQGNANAPVQIVNQKVKLFKKISIKEI